MIFAQAVEKFMKVLRKFFSEILDSSSIVQTVANEDVVEARKFGSVAVVAARIN